MPPRFAYSSKAKTGCNYLTEVKVFDTSNTEVAQQGTATQSSTANAAYPAFNAIDCKINNVAVTLNEQGKNQKIVF